MLLFVCRNQSQLTRRPDLVLHSSLGASSGHSHDQSAAFGRLGPSACRRRSGLDTIPAQTGRLAGGRAGGRVSLDCSSDGASGAAPWRRSAGGRHKRNRNRPSASQVHNSSPRRAKQLGRAASWLQLQSWPSWSSCGASVTGGGGQLHRGGFARHLGTQLNGLPLIIKAAGRKRKLRPQASGRAALGWRRRNCSRARTALTLASGSLWAASGLPVRLVGRPATIGLVGLIASASVHGQPPARTAHFRRAVRRAGGGSARCDCFRRPCPLAANQPRPACRWLPAAGC